MLKIWGRTNSINVQKVLWAADELGVPYQRTEAGRQFGVVTEDWYLKMNPNALIPVIDDGGFVLWESNAIVRYLYAKYGPARSLEEVADADRWMDWFSTTFARNLTPLFQALVRTPPEQRDGPSTEMWRLAAAANLKIVEAHLAGRDYLCGERFTMGDIPLGAASWRWFKLDIERPAMPNLQAWHARLCERPAFRKDVMHPLS